MEMFRRTVTISSHRREELIYITAEVQEVLAASGITEGMLFLYALGATSAIMIQENWDESVGLDMVDLLQRLAPRGVWRHDRQDGNGDAHLKAGLVGPSEAIPVAGGRLGLSRWQDIFFCEFDGPRDERRILCTVMGSAVPLA